jgi:predicted CopG family antitoxin
MANLTLSVSDDLYEKMKKHTELKWSDIARIAFEKKLLELELVEKLLKNSQLTEKDAEIIGHKIKTKIRKRLENDTGN